MISHLMNKTRWDDSDDDGHDDDHSGFFGAVAVTNGGHNVAFQCFGGTKRDKGECDFSYFEGYSWPSVVYWKAISDH